jgi:hypothetical protein
MILQKPTNAYRVNRSLHLKIKTQYLQFLINKPTRCINFSNLFSEWNSTRFGQFLCPSSEFFHCTHSNGICHTGLVTACEQDQDGTAVPSRSCSQVVTKPVWHIPLLCVQWKIPDDRQRNCPKHVKFHSGKNWEISASIWFNIRNSSRCTVTWNSNYISSLFRLFITHHYAEYPRRIHLDEYSPWWWAIKCRNILVILCF